jgi:glycosyltransferase involved in cell wall biosynthesis
MIKQLQPTVSYIMSTFNNEKTIMYSLDSINNINPHILVEIIVVNDGSSDNTRKIIDSYNFVIQNHIIHLESNIGRCYALNMAIGMSKGKYIAIIDADDLEMNQRLEKSVDILNNDSSIDLVGGQYVKFGSWGESSKISKLPTKPRDIAQAFARFRNPIAHSSCMYRRSWFDKLQGYSELFLRCQDLELFIRGFNGSNYVVLPDVFLKYRTDGRFHSLSYYLRQEMWRDRVKLSYSEKQGFKFKLSSFSTFLRISIIYVRYIYYFVNDLISGLFRK